MQDNYSSLSLSHRRMLREMPSHFQRLREAIQINQKFVESIVTSAVGMFENSQVSDIVRSLFCLLVNIPYIVIDYVKYGLIIHNLDTVHRYGTDTSVGGLVVKALD